MASSRKAHVLYKVNKKKVSNEKKIQNLLKMFEKLCARYKKEGHTKWMRNAMLTALARLHKAGFKHDFIEKNFGISIKDVNKKVGAKGASKKAPAKKAAAKPAAEKAPAKKAPAKKPAAEKKAPAKKPAAKKPAAKKE